PGGRLGRSVFRPTNLRRVCDGTAPGEEAGDGAPPTHGAGSPGNPERDGRRRGPGARRDPAERPRLRAGDPREHRRPGPTVAGGGAGARRPRPAPVPGGPGAPQFLDPPAPRSYASSVRLPPPRPPSEVPWESGSPSTRPPASSPTPPRARPRTATPAGSWPPFWPTASSRAGSTS